MTKTPAEIAAGPSNMAWLEEQIGGADPRNLPNEYLQAATAYQLCRIANALEAVREHLENK